MSVQFNEQQLQAINFYKGACNVVASAGSGKSSVLLERIKTLVHKQGEIQHTILAVTFTSKTAKELKQKLKDMNLDRVNVGTFHAICMRIMIREGVNVRGRLVPEWMAEKWFKEIDPKADKKEILSFISYQKSYMRKPNDEFVYKNSNYSEMDLRTFYQVYEENKKKENLYDFDDYLLITLDILKKSKGKYAFEFVLVDEHQDSNLVQNLMLQELCLSGNIFAVGDGKQSIYSFRGGNVEYFMNFEQYWNNPTVINLFMNYRSTNNIVEFSNRFIRPYFKHYEHYVDAKANNKQDGIIKLITTTGEAEEAIKVVDNIENKLNKGDNPEQIAVLYRLNSQSMYIENELRRRGIDYEIANDSSFFKRKEVSAIINILKLISNPHDDMAFEQIFRFRAYPLKFFSNKAFNDIRRYSGKHNISLFEALCDIDFGKEWMNNNAGEFETIIYRLRLQNDKGVRLTDIVDNIIKSFDIRNYIEEKYTNSEESDERLKSLEVLKSFVKSNNLEQFLSFIHNEINTKKGKKNVIKLMTVHASKGLEWDNVLLVGIQDGIFPHELSIESEEARLFYVAVTRSKENLYLYQVGDNKFIRQYFGK